MAFNFDTINATSGENQFGTNLQLDSTTKEYIEKLATFAKDVQTNKASLKDANDRNSDKGVVPNDTFNYWKYVSENVLFRGNLADNFLAEQATLHLLNPLGSRFMNPAGIILSLASDQFETGAFQLLTNAVSQISGGGGALDTTDGKTFGRAIDNDISKLFFSDVAKFSEAFKKNKGEFGAGVANVANQAFLGNREARGVRSIIAQALVGDNTNTSIAGHSTSEQGKYVTKESGLVFIDSDWKKAVNYTYDWIYKLINPIRWRKLKGDYFEKKYAPNKLVEAPKGVVIKDYLGKDISHIKNWTNEERTSLYTFFDKIANSINNDYIITEDKKYINSKLNYTTSSYEKISSQLKLDAYGKLKGVVNTSENINISNHEKKYSDLSEYLTGVNNVPIRTRPEYFMKNSNLSVKITEEQADNIFQTPFENSSKTFFKNSVIFGKYDNSDIFKENENSKDFTTEQFNDEIYLKFVDTRTKNVIVFRPTIDGLTEDFAVNSGDDGAYIGRTEILPSYDKTTWTVSFGFVIYATHPKELLMNIKKMEYLKGLCYPMITGKEQQFVKIPILKLTLGEKYKDVYGVINSLSYTTDDASLWETTKGYRVPRTIRCNVSLSLFHKQMAYVSSVDEKGLTRIKSHGITDLNIFN